MSQHERRVLQGLALLIVLVLLGIALAFIWQTYQRQTQTALATTYAEATQRRYERNAERGMIARTQTEQAK